MSSEIFWVVILVKKKWKSVEIFQEKVSIDSANSELKLGLDELGGFFLQFRFFELLSAEPVVGLLDHKSPRVMELWQTQGEIRHGNQSRPQLIGAFGFPSGYLKNLNKDLSIFESNWKEL